MKELIVSPQNSNQRLDKYLLKLFNTAPKSLIYKLLRKKRIRLNGKRALGSEILCQGDSLLFYLAENTMNGFMAEKEVKPKAPAPNIIYEDENILAANKPAGVLSHGDNSLLEGILFHLYENGDYNTEKTSDFTPALCNRLDRNTSGLVLCGKNMAALRQLNMMMANHQTEKYYIALVKGQLEEKGTLRGYHYKNKKSNEAGIGSNPSEGCEAITEYTPLMTTADYTLLRIKLITGKFHQIRAHMKSIGHPLVGDPKYGDESVNELFRRRYGLKHQLLHSEKIIFTEAAGLLVYLNGMELTAPAEKLFQKIISELC